MIVGVSDKNIMYIRYISMIDKKHGNITSRQDITLLNSEELYSILLLMKEQDNIIIERMIEKLKPKNSMITKIITELHKLGRITIL